MEQVMFGKTKWQVRWKMSEEQVAGNIQDNGTVVETMLKKIYR